MIKANITKLQKEYNILEHDFKVLKIIFIIKELDYSSFSLIEKMLDQTKEYLMYQNDEYLNVVDNNIFELNNVLNELKYQMGHDLNGNIYLLLMNNNNYYLDKILNLINELTVNYSISMLKIDIHKYCLKIINDYLTILKCIAFNELDYEQSKRLNNINLTTTVNINDLQFIYKETKSVMKLIIEKNLVTDDLLNKYYLFELSFIIIMVE